MQRIEHNRNQIQSENGRFRKVQHQFLTNLNSNTKKAEQANFLFIFRSLWEDHDEQEQLQTMKDVEDEKAAMAVNIFILFCIPTLAILI